MRWLVFLVALCRCMSTSLATDIHVPGDYPTIQQAINHAIDGDTVLVAPGTYFENINFKGKAITVKGIHGPAETIIDGNSSGSAVVFDSGEDIRSVITGFTLTNGTGHWIDVPGVLSGGGLCCVSSSPLIINDWIISNTATRGGGIGLIGPDCNALVRECRVENNESLKHGGGIYCHSSYATITKCIIKNNKSGLYGGGIQGMNFDNGCKPLIEYNIIDGNIAKSRGGGIACLSATIPTIYMNIITNNIAPNGGGVNFYDGTLSNNQILYNAAKFEDPTIAYGTGGGVNCSGTNPTIDMNNISFNTAKLAGGGIYFMGYSGTISNNIITHNEANMNSTAVEPIRGGGVLIGVFSKGKTIITNCIISDNYAKDAGGGIFIDYITPEHTSKAKIFNSTIVRNTSQIGSGIYSQGDSVLTITNTILYDSEPNYIYYEGLIPKVTFSNIHGGFPGHGNIDTDPLFVDPANDDFHLQFLSPCRDAGDNTVAELPDTDFEGDPRVAYGTVDMGADEFHPHLYYTGQAVPSAEISIKTIGLPRTDPLAIFLGKGSLETPLPSTYGDWYLDFPVSLVKYGFNIPMTGVYSFDTRIPTVPLDAYYLQALIGDELSNLCTVELE